MDVTEVLTRNGLAFQRGKKALLAKLNQLRPIDPLLQPVFIAPRAWAIYTAYIKGEAVANGGNWYICNTAGTSAGSGGPTGTGTTLITDNTAKWQFFCVARSLTTVDAPTIATTGSVPGDLTVSVSLATLYNKRFTQPTALSVVDSGGGQMNPTSLPKNASEIISAGQWNFWTDAPRFSWNTNYCAALRIIVDGVTVTLGDYKTANETGQAYVTLDFNGVRKPRRIQVIGPENSQSLRITALDRVWQDDAPAAKGLFIGDSWGIGAAPGPSRREDSAANQMARALGIGEGLINGSVGGSGFYTTNGGTVYNYLQRMAAAPAVITAANLDFVYLEGTGNDIGTASDAVLQAQMLAVMQKARELSPYAVIAVSEILSTTLPADAGVIALNGLLKAAFDQFADANSVFIYVSSANTPEGQAWVGTDNSGVYVNTGDAHPLDAGLEYLGHRLARSFKLALAA